MKKCQWKPKNLISSGTAYTKPEVIAEVVYVLKGVYNIERKEIRSFIYTLLKEIHCGEVDCVLYSMDIYAESSLDFVDCLLIAYNKINKENVFSFDKKLNKKLEFSE